MATLDGAQRFALRAEWGAELSRRAAAFDLSKPDLDAAIVAVDDWVASNAAAYNAVLPPRARTTLTPAQKAELLALVVTHRFRKGV